MKKVNILPFFISVLFFILAGCEMDSITDKSTDIQKNLSENDGSRSLASLGLKSGDCVSINAQRGRATSNFYRENIALNKPATQSSIAYSGSAMRAVDGNTSGLWSSNSVTHTKTEKSWWQVDLEKDCNIETIYVWNRTDPGFGDRLVGAVLEVRNEKNELVYSKTITSSNAKNIFSVFRTARYVKIKHTTNKILSLAEVEVFSSDNFLTVNGQNNSLNCTNDLNIKSKWELYDRGYNTYAIRSIWTGRYLSAMDGANGSAEFDFTENLDNAIKWYIAPVKNTYNGYTIIGYLRSGKSVQIIAGNSPGHPVLTNKMGSDYRTVWSISSVKKYQQETSLQADHFRLNKGPVYVGRNNVRLGFENNQELKNILLKNTIVEASIEVVMVDDDDKLVLADMKDGKWSSYTTPYKLSNWNWYRNKYIYYYDASDWINCSLPSGRGANFNNGYPETKLYATKKKSKNDAHMGGPYYEDRYKIFYGYGGSQAVTLTADLTIDEINLILASRNFYMNFVGVKRTATNHKIPKYYPPQWLKDLWNKNATIYTDAKIVDLILHIKY